MSKIFLLAVCLLFHVLTPAQADPLCTYSTYKWNTIQGKAVEFKRIEKRYSQLTKFERDAMTGCTVCEQDQVAVKLDNIDEFKVCHVLAEPLREVLSVLISSGQGVIETVVAYRVGMTRGDVDAHGNRTGFSNHSFGIAIDINSEHNGLYDQCLVFNASCRLIKGGPWRPGQNRLSLSHDSEIVQKLKRLGWVWGGQIAGKQKDFMHFSTTGY